MLRTVFWFGAGGFFTSCFANAVRRIPVLKKPSFHAAAIGIGVLIGYQAHLFESSAENRYKDMLKTHEGLPLYQYLLAETATQTEEE